MAEKRFTLKKYTSEDYAILDNGIEIAYASNKSAFTFCELLNKLHSRNKRLEEKIQRERVSFIKTEERWSKEAENKIKELSDENEGLKKELQTYRKVVGCFNCRYHNYDWYDDGDEFEVCDKGNDVTESICEEWEEL